MESRLILSLFSFAVLLFSCSEQKSHTAPAIRERDSVSLMVSYGVNTLISDSGVIKYRIVTERWEVNTVKNPTRWIFEKGIFMEQYDKDFHVEGYISADSAWYFDQLKLWELRGRVSIRNVNGLDFRSDEQMTHYEVSNSVGSFQTSDMEGDDSNSQQPAANGQPATATPQQPDAGSPQPQRPAATRKAASQKSIYRQ